jgi:hypothetical protein
VVVHVSSLGVKEYLSLVSFEVFSQFLRVRGPFGSIDTDPVREIEAVTVISGKYVNMEVPEILVSGWFIVLASGCSVAVIRCADGYSYPLGDLVNLCDCVIGNVVDIFVVVIGYHDYMALVVGPGPRSNKCSYIASGIDDVLSAIALSVSAGYEIAKRAAVVFWRVAMHSGYCTLGNGNLTNE